MRYLACILALAVGSAVHADTPLKQSTAVTVKLGPFVDSTDGVTAETSLTISQADVRLSKAGGDYAQKNESSAATHDELGEYDVDLDTTDTATLGPLRVMVQESGALPVWRDFVVLPANVYDSLYGADLLQVDAAELSGDSTAADNLEAAADGTGYNLGNGDIVAASVTAGSDAAWLTTTIDGLTNQTTFSLAAGAADDDALIGWSVLIIDQSTSTQVATGVISDYTASGFDVVLDEDPGVFTIASGDTVKIYRPETVAGSVTVEGTVTATISGTVDANLEEINGTPVTESTGGNLAGNFSTLLDNGDAATSVTVDDIGDILTDTGTTLPGTLATISAGLITIDTTADAILVDTAEIGAAGAGLTAVPYNSAWDAEIQSEATDALNAYDGPTNAEMEARTVASSSYFDPSADEVDLGSIKGTALTESAGGQLAAGFSYWYDVETPAKTMNDAGVAGSGLSAEDVWTYGTRTLSGTIQTLDALDTAQDTQHAATQSALSTVDGNIDSILVDTAEIGAAGAGLSAIPWNSSWDAETQSEVNDALVAIHLDHLLAVEYDPASKPGVGTALLNETVWNNSGVSIWNTNVTYMNEAEVSGTGTDGDPWTGAE